VGLIHPFVHDASTSEDIFQGALFFEEVLTRIQDGLGREKLQLEEKKRKKTRNNGNS
jgi:hypothetical protein